jgi:hypothetical protein
MSTNTSGTAGFRTTTLLWFAAISSGATTEQNERDFAPPQLIAQRASITVGKSEVDYSCRKRVALKVMPRLRASERADRTIAPRCSQAYAMLQMRMAPLSR